jgi:hypothetical protein
MERVNWYDLVGAKLKIRLEERGHDGYMSAEKWFKYSN